MDSRTVEVPLGDMVWMLLFMPYDEATKIVERYKLRVYYCPQCGSYMEPHKH